MQRRQQQQDTFFWPRRQVSIKKQNLFFHTINSDPLTMRAFQLSPEMSKYIRPMSPQ